MSWQHIGSPLRGAIASPPNAKRWQSPPLNGAQRDLLEDYQQGPFSSAEVPSFPAELVALYQNITGREFSPEAMEVYERLRALVDYEGIQSHRGVSQVVDREGEPHQAPQTQGQRARAVGSQVPTPWSSGRSVDATDLGD